MNRDNYFVNLFLAFDKLLNAVAGGRHTETISHRSARAAANGARGGCVICKFLNFFHRDHCSVVLSRNESSISHLAESLKSLHWSDLSKETQTVIAITLFILVDIVFLYGVVSGM